MKIRKLQHLNENQRWVDEAYAYEDETGRIEFRYNPLTWGRVGAALNRKIQAEGITLEEIETVIPPDEEACWLVVEIVDGELTEIIAALDEACHFPHPRPIPLVKRVVA